MRSTRASLGPSDARTPWHVPFPIATLLAVATYLLLLLVIVLTAPAGQTGLARPALVLLSCAVVVSCGRTAWLATGVRRRVWLLFAAAGTLWSVGQVLSFVQRGKSGLQPWTLVVFLLAMVPVAWALFAMPPERRVRSERLRMWLGAWIVLGSVVVFCRSMVEGVPRPDHLASQGVVLLNVAAPLVYLAMASLLWIVLLRVGTLGRSPLFLVAAGLIVLMWANVYSSYFGYSGSGAWRAVLDASSAWCYLMITLASLSPRAIEPPQPPSMRTQGWYIGLQSLLVYVPVLATGLTIVVLPRNPDWLVIGLGLVVLVLFGARLMLLSVDNSRLRGDLEVQVDDLVQRSSDLRRLGQQNERIVQSVVDGVIGVDADAVITFANPAALAMLGYERDALLGVDQHQIFHNRNFECDTGTANCCVVHMAMRTGVASVSAGESFWTATGIVLAVELAVGPILEEHGITGAVVVFRDVSERRKIERMKNEFVSVVSHELRTPLTSIRGSLGLLAGGAAGQLSPPAGRMVSVALESSERLTRLINDMLDIERIESGTMPLHLAACKPRDLLEQAVGATQGVAGQHRLLVVSEPGLPPVLADADRIVQTLTNLIGNAIKFSPLLTTIRIAADGRDGQVEFSVTDEGRGIPANKLSRIFERFEQVDSSDSRELGGSGLGLAISRSIMHRHGGDLVVASQQGKGSTFSFRLAEAPLAQSRHQAEAVPAGQAR